jgi:hypothetical protein
MSLATAIAVNRFKQHKYHRAERVLRQIRLRIFDYEDEGPEKYAKAKRVMARCQKTLAPLWRAQRAAADDRKLQRTPSAFEPGCR